jgi:hypothetical protein
MLMAKKKATVAIFLMPSLAHFSQPLVTSFFTSTYVVALCSLLRKRPLLFALPTLPRLVVEPSDLLTSTLQLSLVKGELGCQSLAQ